MYPKFLRQAFVSRKVGSIFWTGWVCCSFQKFNGSAWFCVVQRSKDEIFVCSQEELEPVVPSALDAVV